VSKDGCSYYSFTIDEDEKIAGEISSKEYFNVYFVTPRNFRKHKNGKRISITSTEPNMPQE
jgi:hypothetical protein